MSLRRGHSAFQLAQGFLIPRAPQYVSSSRHKTGMKNRVMLTPSNLQPFRMVFSKMVQAGENYDTQDYGKLFLCIFAVCLQDWAKLSAAGACAQQGIPRMLRWAATPHTSVPRMQNVSNHTQRELNRQCKQFFALCTERPIKTSTYQRDFNKRCN